MNGYTTEKIVGKRNCIKRIAKIISKVGREVIVMRYGDGFRILVKKLKKKRMKKT